MSNSARTRTIGEHAEAIKLHTPGDQVKYIKEHVANMHSEEELGAFVSGIYDVLSEHARDIVFEVTSDRQREWKRVAAAASTAPPGADRSVNHPPIDLTGSASNAVDRPIVLSAAITPPVTAQPQTNANPSRESTTNAERGDETSTKTRRVTGRNASSSSATGAPEERRAKVQKRFNGSENLRPMDRYDVNYLVPRYVYTPSTMRLNRMHAALDDLTRPPPSGVARVASSIASVIASAIQPAADAPKQPAASAGAGESGFDARRPMASTRLVDTRDTKTRCFPRQPLAQRHARGETDNPITTRSAVDGGTSLRDHTMGAALAKVLGQFELIRLSSTPATAHSSEKRRPRSAHAVKSDASMRTDSTEIKHEALLQRTIKAREALRVSFGSESSLPTTDAVDRVRGTGATRPFSARTSTHPPPPVSTATPAALDTVKRVTLSDEQLRALRDLQNIVHIVTAEVCLLLDVETGTRADVRAVPLASSTRETLERVSDGLGRACDSLTAYAAQPRDVKLYCCFLRHWFQCLIELQAEVHSSGLSDPLVRVAELHGGATLLVDASTVNEEAYRSILAASRACTTGHLSTQPARLTGEGETCTDVMCRYALTYLLPTKQKEK